MNGAYEALDQRCTYSNCKDWLYTDPASYIIAETCTSCWTEADVASWADWDARKAYSKSSVHGRKTGVDPEGPFK